MEAEGGREANDVSLLIKLFLKSLVEHVSSSEDGGYAGGTWARCTAIK